MKQASVDMVCHYSQKSRMEEVVKLLKLAKYYVLEAGYRLGFTTLRHLRCLFENHYGLTPRSAQLAPPWFNPPLVRDKPYP